MSYENIRARVSDRTIEKVTRLFNQKISDIIPEMLQNARRAGATQIEIETACRDSRGTFLTITDNGQGISDPQSILTLGASGWGQAVISAEDPAGMGFFSLAGRTITIRSRANGALEGWCAVIPAEAWTGEQEICVLQSPAPQGTTIIIPTDENEHKSLTSIIREATRFLPVDVIVDKTPIERSDFLEGAIHIEDWNGCRIGVFRNYHHHVASTINFHGHGVKTSSPFTVEQIDGVTFSACIDMGPSNDIQLVLPARKEVVENAAWSNLKRACKKAVYRAIAQQEHHSLAVKHWLDAKTHGITLPEANPQLCRWQPKDAEGQYRSINAAETIDRHSIIVSPMSPLMEQCVARTIAGSSVAARLFTAQPDYRGYSWYDALTTLADAKFSVASDTLSLEFCDDDPCNGEDLDLPNQRVDEIILHLLLEDSLGTQTVEMPSDFAALRHERYCSDVEDLVMFWTQDATQNISAILELLERGAFAPHYDMDCDTAETQRGYFIDELRPLLTSLMVNEAEAAREEMARIMAMHRYLIPSGMRASITIDANILDISLLPISSPA